MPGAGTRSDIDVSIVTAVHDVARYLPQFIASIESQRGTDLDRVEVIAVDDGSTDASLLILRQWQQVSVLPITVLSRPNGGQAAARNLGLQHARGAWVTFIDPDDSVGPRYLSQVLKFIHRHPQAELVGTALIIRDDRTGRRQDSHPLRHRHRTDRLVDLNREPGYFYASAPAAFLRRTRIEALGLRFDEGLRPTFEDGHFCARYLLGCPTPWVGLLSRPGTTTASGPTGPRPSRQASSRRNGTQRFPGVAISICSPRQRCRPVRHRPGCSIS